MRDQLRREHLARFYSIVENLDQKIGGAQKLADCLVRMNWPSRNFVDARCCTCSGLLLADCVAKRFCASECARLIQDELSRRKVDSEIHSLRFDCCVFLFYSFSAVTFATQSAHLGPWQMSDLSPQSISKRKGYAALTALGATNIG
jgi:hypothetical protein